MFQPSTGFIKVGEFNAYCAELSGDLSNENRILFTLLSAQFIPAEGRLFTGICNSILCKECRFKISMEVVSVVDIVIETKRLRKGGSMSRM